MTHPATPLGDCPSSSQGGQLSFYDLEDPTWESWLISRLSRGDMITVERNGDLVIF